MLRPKLWLVAAVLILVPDAHGQNGKLIDRKILTLDESLSKELKTKAPGSFATIEQVEMSEITYLSDGLKVKGFVLAPKKDGRFPVLIFNRGGCRSIDAHALTKYFVARWLSIFANWGYVVVASQYRGAGGGEGKEEFGGADVNDVLSLIPLLGSLPKADPSRIGMYGWSRGALMTYLALTKTDKVRAAIVGAGPTDLSTIGAYRKALRPDDDFEDFCLRAVIANYEQSKQKELEVRSPIKWPEKLNRNTPILILHGTADWRVSPRDSLNMAAALLKLKQPFRLVMFEGGDHELTEYLEEADRITKDWLDRYVRDKQTWPSLEPHGN